MTDRSTAPPRRATPERVEVILDRIVMAAARGESARKDEQAIVDRVEAADRYRTALERARSDFLGIIARTPFGSEVEEAAEAALTRVDSVLREEMQRVAPAWRSELAETLRLYDGRPDIAVASVRVGLMRDIAGAAATEGSRG